MTFGFRFIGLFLMTLFFNFSVYGQVSETVKKEADQSMSRLDTITLPVKILRVVDGDTAEFIYHELFLKIRLADIDAPETRGGQPFGRAAGRYLRKRMEGKEVILKGQRRLDGFGRYLGTIYLKDGTNINKEMVEKGYAWHFKKYSRDDSFGILEREARRHKRGLWQDKNPIAPWDYRKGKR